MTATIKIDDMKKEKIERFLASLMLQNRRKISLQEAVELMIDYALENEEELVKKLELPPLEKDPAWKALENPKNWGTKDSSKKTDETLYG